MASTFYLYHATWQYFHASEARDRKHVVAIFYE